MKKGRQEGGEDHYILSGAAWAGSQRPAKVERQRRALSQEQQPPPLPNPAPFPDWLGVPWEAWPDSGAWHSEAAGGTAQVASGSLRCKPGGLVFLVAK